MHQTRWFKFVVFASLYLAQGVPHGFVQQTAPAILRERGYSLKTISLLGLFFLPWVFKFIWAPLADRGAKSRGGRRVWILAMQMVSILALLGLSFWRPDQILAPFLAGIMAVSLAASMQDAATDGFAVNLLDRKEIGWGNGIQIGGFWLGFVLGGGILLALHPYLGWQRMMLLMAAVLLVACLPLLWVKVKDTASSTQAPIRIRNFTGQAFGWRLLAIIVLARMSGGWARMLLNPLLVDMGYSLADIGKMVGILGSLGALAGAVIGAFLANPLGRRKALLIFLAIQILPLLGYALVSLQGWHSTTVLMPLIALDHAANSMATLAIFSLMMDWSSRQQSSTDYAFQDCMGIFGTMVISMGAAWMAQSFAFNHPFQGYATTFMIGAASILATLWVLSKLFPSKDAAVPAGLSARLQPSST